MRHLPTNRIKSKVNWFLSQSIHLIEIKVRSLTFLAPSFPLILFNWNHLYKRLFYYILVIFHANLMYLQFISIFYTVKKGSEFFMQAFTVFLTLPSCALEKSLSKVNIYNVKPNFRMIYNSIIQNELFPQQLTESTNC